MSKRKNISPKLKHKQELTLTKFKIKLQTLFITHNDTYPKSTTAQRGMALMMLYLLVEKVPRSL